MEPILKASQIIKRYKYPDTVKLYSLYNSIAFISIHEQSRLKSLICTYKNYISGPCNIRSYSDWSLGWFPRSFALIIVYDQSKSVPKSIAKLFSVNSKGLWAFLFFVRYIHVQVIMNGMLAYEVFFYCY